MQKLIKSKELQWKQRLSLYLSQNVAFPQKSSLLKLFLPLLLISCATSPENFSKYEQGSWRGKSLVQDLKKNKSYVVSVDINAIRPSLARLDIETSLGIHLASMTLNQDKVEILLPEQRKFYSGKASPQSMKKVIPIELDPNWLMKILFDEKFASKDWQCVMNKSGHYESCKRKGLSIKWLQRKRQMRVVALETDSAKVQLQLKGFKPEAKEESFYKLPNPPGFKSFKLR